MQTIDYRTLHQMQDQEDDFLLLNVLSEEDFRENHIEGSVNIPLSEPDFIEQVESKIGSKNKVVVTYCASRDCDASLKAAQKLMANGFTNVRAYEGGMNDWDAHRGPMAA